VSEAFTEQGEVSNHRKFPPVYRLTSHLHRSSLAKKVPEKNRQICRIASSHSFPLIGPQFFEIQVMSSTDFTHPGQ